MVSVRFFVIILTIFSTQIIVSSSRRQNSVTRVLEALEKGLGFFDKEACDINLDGIYGLRVAEGQLQIISENHAYLRERNPTVWRRLQVLHNVATGAAQKAQPCLKEKDQDYFKRFKPLVDKPFTPTYETRHSETISTLPKLLSNSYYNEPEGDQCFVDLMGTGDNPKCTVSDKCWKMMTSFNSPNFRRYIATHSVLYLIMVEHLGCTENATHFLEENHSIETLRQSGCDSIYTEMKTFPRNGQVYIALQDLFLEQQLVCGMIGFEDVIRPDWLDMNLAMQDGKLGCFGYRDVKEATRKLLTEHLLDDGCSSHKSGIGIGTLGIYLRVLIDHKGKFPDKLRLETFEDTT